MFEPASLLRSTTSAIAALLLLAGASHADVKLPRVISDHMVVQRDIPVRIWGWAEPGEKVTVTFVKNRAATVAGKDGKWSVELPALSAGGPHELVVAGANTL